MVVKELFVVEMVQGSCSITCWPNFQANKLHAMAWQVSSHDAPAQKGWCSGKEHYLVILWFLVVLSYGLMLSASVMFKKH